MKTLYVIYDSRCGLCTQIRDWLRGQPAYVNLRLMAKDSPEARRMFPTVSGEELTIVSDDGRVWLDDHAFIVCLWALRRYRGWARRLASPMLRPMARQAFAAVSRHRQGISTVLRLESEEQLRKRLKEEKIPPCPMK